MWLDSWQTHWHRATPNNQTHLLNHHTVNDHSNPPSLSPFLVTHLHREAGPSDHGKAAIVDLLSLELVEGIGIEVGGEVEGVKAQLAGNVFVLDLKKKGADGGYVSESRRNCRSRMRETVGK
jgi:hypothetical protein